MRDWFLKVLRARAREGQVNSEQQIAELNRQLAVLRNQQNRLLNLRLLDEIDEATFAAKNTELRDRIAALHLQLQGCNRSRAEKGEIAERAFELSQTRAKRQLLENVCLNFRLDGVTLVPAIRKPFDVLAEGLFVSSNRGDKI